MTKVEKVSFEEAMDLTGFGKYNLLTFLLCSSIILAMVFEIFSVAYLVPGSACELVTTSSQQGLMAAVPLIGIIATSNVWGYLADTRGRRKVLIMSMALAFVAGALAALSPDWITFSVLKFLSSSSVSGSFALSLTLLSESTPEAKRSALVVLTSTVFVCCNGIMAVIAIPVLPLKFSYYIPLLDIHFNSWRALNLIYCSPCAISAFGLLFAYESPKFLLGVGKDEQALKILKGMFVINNNKRGEDYPVKALMLEEENVTQNKATGFFSSVLIQTMPLFKPPLLRNTILVSIIFVIVYISINPLFVWLPFMVDGFMRSVQRGDTDMSFCERLRATQNTTIDQVQNHCALNETALTMVFVIGMLLACINTIATGLIHYIGRKNLFIIVQFAAGIGGICVNTVSMWYLSAVFFIIFIAGVTNFGVLSAFSVDIFPTYVKAMAVCLTLMMGRGSAVFGINLLKSMLDSNCEASFYIFGSVAILGGVLGFLLPADVKRPTRKCPES